jgi:small subunit ribosomal protein S2
MAPVVTMRQLLESGVHFGHQTRRWNPKMKRFIFTERNGIYIIDLQQSLDFIDRAYEFIKETVAHGGSVLYVGTKKQAQEAIAEQARRVGMPFVNQRWLGGMLTNFTTVYKRLQRLKELEEIDFEDVTGSSLTKKELLHLKRERDKLERSLGGIRDMARVPSALWVVDTKKEHIAVSEARKLGIPVIAILDTNCDPDEVTYPIPGNDDAIRSVALLTRVVADAVADGLIARAGSAAGEEKPSVPGADGVLGSAEPLAEWERALLLEGRAADGADGTSPAGQTANGGGSAPADASAAGTAPAARKPSAGQVAAPSSGAVEAAPAPAAPAETPVPAVPAASVPAGDAPVPAAPVPAVPATAVPAGDAPVPAAPVPAAPATAVPAADAPVPAAPAAETASAGAPVPAAPAAETPAEAPPAAEAPQAAETPAEAPPAPEQPSQPV